MEEKQLQAFVTRLREIQEDTEDKFRERKIKIGENRAFARGMQHGVVNGEGNWIPLKAKDPRISLETVPVLPQTVAVAVERRLAAWPTIEVRAPSPGVVAELQAETMEDMSREIMSWRDDFYLQHVICAYAAEIDGACLGKVFWDPHRAPDGKGGFLGDWKFLAVSIKDALIDPIAESWDQARYVIQKKIFGKTDSEAKMPTDFFGKPTFGRFAPVGMRRRGIGAEDEMRLGLARTEENEAIEIVEHWWKPCAEFPRGLLAVTSGDMLLDMPVAEDGTPTLPDGFFPWEMNFGTNLVPFSLYPDGGVSRLIPLQKALNHNASRNRQALNWGSMPAFLIPTQSEIVQKSFSDVGGDVIHFRAPFKPEILAGPGVSAGHLNNFANLRSMINDASGQTDESRGVVDSANATGARLRASDALNARLHGSTLALAGYFVASIFQKIFALMANRYDEGRFIHLRGKNAKTRVQAFTAGMINPDCKFVIDPSSVNLKNKDAEAADARQDFAAGIFDDTPAANRFRRVTGLYHGSGEHRDEHDVDYRRAREEDAAFLLSARAGLPAELAPQVADDHEIHLAVHRLTMLEPEFIALPQPVKDAYLRTMVIPHQQMRDALLTDATQEGQPPAPGEEGAKPGSAPAERGIGGRPGGGEKTPFKD